MIDLGVRQAARAEAPLIVFWLHKGADSFMSDADFRTFYWPTLKAVMKGLIEQGIVPAMFAEGELQQAARGDRRRRAARRQRHLDVRPDRHGGCQARSRRPRLHRRQRAHRAPRAGHAPPRSRSTSPTCSTSAPPTAASSSATGPSLDDAKAENLKAMIETGRNWRG